MNTMNAGRGPATPMATGHAVARWCTLAAMVLVGSLAPAPHAGQAAAEGADLPLPLSLATGSVLSLEGTSTLHDFESRTTQSTLTLTRDPATTVGTGSAGLAALVRGAGVRGLDLDVPVLTLRSEKSALDKNLWKALKATQYPTIHFHLAKYSILGSPTADTLTIRGEGTLSIAGVQRPDTLDAKVFHTPQGLWLTGSEPLLMSTFGITPPKMMMGTLRVADAIVVRYRLLLAPKSEAAMSPSSSTN